MTHDDFEDGSQECKKSEVGIPAPSVKELNSAKHLKKWGVCFPLCTQKQTKAVES